MKVSVYHDYIAAAEDVIEEARNGQMFILMDATTARTRATS